MNNEAMIEAQALVTTLLSYTEVASQGAAALAKLKNAIVLMSEMTGFRLIFAPGTDPDLIDYLAIMFPRAVEGAAVGSLLGLLLGAIADRPAHGAAIGAGLGAVVGAAQGLDAVNQGWRVRAQYLHDGALYIRQF